MCAGAIKEPLLCKTRSGFASRVEREADNTVNSGSEMMEAKHVSEKNIFYTSIEDKIWEERISEILHCAFEGWAEEHHLSQPDGPVGWC